MERGLEKENKAQQKEKGRSLLSKQETLRKLRIRVGRLCTEAEEEDVTSSPLDAHEISIE